MARRSLWHLRYRKSSSVLSTDNPNGNINDDNSNARACSPSAASYNLRDHSAATIFSVGRQREDRKLRIVEPDSEQELEYSLTQAVNQKPQEAQIYNLDVENKNVTASPFFDRMRVYVLTFKVITIILGYLALFVVLNLIFAILWYLPEENCCGDSTMSFAEVLNFAVQTSTTLGYGGQEPVGLYSNTLVALNFFVSLTLHAIFAGIIFLKFVTPSAKLEFSEIITLSNLNGLPCLEVRVGNADGCKMIIQDLTARLNFMYNIHYEDDLGKTQKFATFQDLTLLVDWRLELREVWTLRHVIDETSPLFGVLGVDDLEKDIMFFSASITGLQAVTKMHVSASATYKLHDILVGYKFQDQLEWHPELQKLVIDYGKMNEIVPHPVWYPTQEAPAKGKREEDGSNHDSDDDNEHKKKGPPLRRTSPIGEVIQEEV